MRSAPRNMPRWMAALLTSALGCSHMFAEPSAARPAPKPAPEPELRGCAKPKVAEGALPDGVSASDSRAVIEGKLGLPSTCEGQRCEWVSIGLEVDWVKEQGARYDAMPTCLGAARRIPPLGVGVLRVNGWDDDRERLEGVWHVGAAARYTFHAPAPGKLVVHTRLEDEERKLVKVALLRSGHDEACNALQTMAKDVAGAAAGSTLVNFPYHTLALSEGKHTLTPVLEAEFRPKDGQPMPVKVEPSERASLAITIDQPATRWLRVGVREIQVAPANADFSSHPDLRWTIDYKWPLATSSERAGSLRGTWTKLSDWIRVSVEDAVRVEVTDVDLAYDDFLAAFYVNVADLVARATVSRTENHVSVILGVELADKPPTDATCRSSAAPPESGKAAGRRTRVTTPTSPRRSEVGGGGAGAGRLREAAIEERNR
jgi:hypothetical protein